MGEPASRETPGLRPPAVWACPLAALACPRLQVALHHSGDTQCQGRSMRPPPPPEIREGAWRLPGTSVFSALPRREDPEKMAALSDTKDAVLGAHRKPEGPGSPTVATLWCPSRPPLLTLPPLTVISSHAGLTLPYTRRLLPPQSLCTCGSHGPEWPSLLSVGLASHLCRGLPGHPIQSHCSVTPARLPVLPCRAKSGVVAPGTAGEVWGQPCLSQLGELLAASVLRRRSSAFLIWGQSE